MTTARGDGDGERLTSAVMPPVAVLRGHQWNVIHNATEHPDGIVLEIGPPGRLARRHLLLAGVTAVLDLDRLGWTQADEAQRQIDIGDELYERQRYGEHDIDITPDRDPPHPRRHQ